MEFSSLAAPKVVKWQLSVQSMMKISSKLWHFCVSAYIYYKPYNVMLILIGFAFSFPGLPITYIRTYVQPWNWPPAYSRLQYTPTRTVRVSPETRCSWSWPRAQSLSSWSPGTLAHRRQLLRWGLAAPPALIPASWVLRSRAAPAPSDCTWVANGVTLMRTPTLTPCLPVPSAFLTFKRSRATVSIRYPRGPPHVVESRCFTRGH